MKPAHKSGQLAISRQGVPGPSDPWGFQLRSAESCIPEDRLVNWETAHGPQVQDIHEGSENHRSGFFPERFLHTSLHGRRARHKRAVWESVA